MPPADPPRSTRRQSDQPGRVRRAALRCGSRTLRRSDSASVRKSPPAAPCARPRREGPARWPLTGAYEPFQVASATGRSPPFTVGRADGRLPDSGHRPRLRKADLTRFDPLRTLARRLRSIRPQSSNATIDNTRLSCGRWIVKHKSIVLAALILGSSTFNYAVANYVRPFNADEQMLKSDLVIVGLVESTAIDENVKFFEKKSAKIIVKLVIKGDKSYTDQIIFLPISGGTSEFNLIHCCTTGKMYVMFLEETKDRFLFTSTNIDHSIYEVP